MHQVHIRVVVEFLIKSKTWTLNTLFAEKDFKRSVSHLKNKKKLITAITKISLIALYELVGVRKTEKL